MYECFILTCLKKWFGDTETFCFNIIKTKYFDFLFWNKPCCLKTDLNFRKGFFFFFNQSYIMKKSIYFSVEENAWLYSFPSSFWIWRPNWKIHIHPPFSLLTLMSHLQLLKKKKRQRLHPATHHCHYSTSLLPLRKKEAAKTEFCPCPKAWCHPRYVQPLGGPGTGRGRCLPTPQGPTAPGLVPCQALCPYQGFV